MITMRVTVRDGKLIAPFWIRALRVIRIIAIVGPFAITDRLPWFLRKPIMNWLLGQECYRDLAPVREPFEYICIKW